MIRHHFSDNANSFNITDSFNNSTNSYNNVWINPTAADEKSELLAWLSPLEPWIWHEEIRTSRVDEVGDRLLRTREYRNWSDGSRGGESGGSALFCYGGPGVGKTYTSSLVIDALCEQAVEENATVACFYFDSTVQKDQSPTAILGSVLKQIVGGLEAVPEKIFEAFRDRGSGVGGQRLILSEIVGLLQDISSSRGIFICIDALDECRAVHRVKLLDSLNEILQESPRTRIFLTGRPHVRDEVEKRLARRVATRSIKPTKGDIVRFLRAKLGEDAMPGAMDESLEEDIIQNINIPAVPEMFLLASLSIETILQEATIPRRRQKLSETGRSLDFRGAYETMLGRIKGQSEKAKRLGMAALMWISHSRRPLRVDEICHAIATQIGSNDLKNDDIPAISTLLDYCQGLITIDNSTSTVMLIYPTLKKYLHTHPDIIAGAHSKMAEVCLTYLNFRHVKDLSASTSPDPRGTHFLEYSSLYWGAHMRMGLSDPARESARTLLHEFESHISAKSLWDSIRREYAVGSAPDLKPFSALHCISYFGIAEVASALIKEHKLNVNHRDNAGMTPLIWAARYGHKEMVEFLLQEKQIQPDQEDENYSRTALSWAAQYGHEAVVGLFLERQFVNPRSIGSQWEKAGRAANQLFGRRCVNPRSIGNQWEKVGRAANQLFGRRYVNPDSSGEYGRTPLSFAAENGHEGIVKLLLERGDVNPNGSDRYGRTPLLWAARNGRKGVVQQLLGQDDLNPDIPDAGYSQTPLSWAAGNGHEEVVKLLLKPKNVNPNSSAESSRTPLLWAAKKVRQGIVKLLSKPKNVDPNGSAESGRTPLLWAAENGHEGIVKQLLERGVNPNIRSGEYGQTPLSRAAQNGREGVVMLLLGRSDVNPDTRDIEFGRTPLSWAAENGREGVVKLLLEQKGVNPDNLSKSGRTPLWLAAANGHKGIVELLLEQKDVNPDTPDGDCRTPPSGAAGNGREGAVELLLERRGSEPHNPRRSGRTLLLCAAQNGCEGAVKLLLRRKNPNPDTRDKKFGRTPLSWAAGNGHEGIVKLLLAREDVRPDTPDTKFGRTPLSRAARNGHEGIVKLLLERRDASPDAAETGYGQTPLSRAAQNGHEDVVRLLLEKGGVKPDTRDTKFGRTPLSWAAGNGHRRIVELLLEQKDVNPDAQDEEFGRTPLSWAAGDGHEGVVELLLKRQVKPHSSSKSGRTPLLWAAENGHEGIVKLLLEQKDVNPDTADDVFGQTPLSWAARNGREGVVKLLLEKKGVDPNSSSKSGQTPLTLAAENGHDRIVELLRVRDPRHISALDPYLIINL